MSTEAKAVNRQTVGSQLAVNRQSDMHSTGGFIVAKAYPYVACHLAYTC